jgi:transcriptional regulator with PAS, ATPase and Fis domain
MKLEIAILADNNIIARFRLPLKRIRKYSMPWRERNKKKNYSGLRCDKKTTVAWQLDRINEALDVASGNRAKAAKLTGIPERSLYRKIEKE